MKKIITLLVLLVCITSVFSQVEIKPGIKGGVNFSKILNTDNTSGLTSFHIKGTVSFKFSDFYTLQPEIGYSGQGAEFKRSFGDDSSSTTLGYLTLPISNKFFIYKTGIHLEIGASLDFLVDHENIDDPQKFDFSIFIGGGYELTNDLSFGIRFKQGLSDLFGRNVNTGEGTETTEFSELYLNQVFQLSFAYQFDF